MQNVQKMLKSFMLLELFRGLKLTGRYFFAKKITVQYPEEKTPPVEPLSSDCTRYAVIRRVKSVASPVSSARWFVPRWLSRLRPSLARMARGGPLSMISTSSNASIVAFVKRPVPSTLSSRRGFLNTISRTGPAVL